ncbi:MAG: hypothetical protein ACM3PD_00680 [Chloroflexota bacterium]|jgi:hypothetical protein
MRASLRELIVAVFNGAPSPQAAQTYSAQLTALISIYICLVAVFLIGLYIRRAKRTEGLLVEQRLFKIWMARSLIFAILMIIASLVFFYFSID